MEKVCLEDAAKTKEDEVRSHLSRMGKAIIAFSGGVDSSYLAYVAYQELKHGMLAVLNVSPSLSAREKNRALEFLRENNIPYRLIETNELCDPSYSKNGDDRCYHCKKSLFIECQRIQNELSMPSIAYGYTADDIDDFRPGQKAASEYQVLRPLYDAGMTKQEIRDRSKRLGLRNFDRPAQPCLASRLTYGTRVTGEHLHAVELVEDCLIGLGFNQCRARYDGTAIRIEVKCDDIPKIVQNDIREAIVKAAIDAGAVFVSLDLEGFASGKTNRMIHKRQ